LKVDDWSLVATDAIDPVARPEEGLIHKALGDLPQPNPDHYLVDELNFRRAPGLEADNQPITKVDLAM
jgi:hypothetical protein